MQINTSLINNIKTEKKTLKHTSSMSQKPSSSISFKGLPPTLIAAADKPILNIFSQNYGPVADRIGQKLGKLATSSPVLKSSARFNLEKGVSSITPKSVPRGLFENVLFPFINLPLYAASWAIKKVGNLPFLKKETAAKIKNIYNKPILRIPRKLNDLDARTDMMKGIFDKTQDVVSKFAKQKGMQTEDLVRLLNNADDNSQIKKEASEFVKESLYKVSNKFFDKHTGNFNTAYERPLNRIITGLIPVAFLANDAYNLSVLCGDKKETSTKEAKERAKQEISRVFTTAYIQLLTFGACTKWVNTIPWFTPLTSAITVLISETSSRKRLGRPIFFLSKEKAKEHNRNSAVEKGSDRAKEKPVAATEIQKTQKTQGLKPVTVNNQPKQVLPNLDNSKVFTSFKAVDSNSQSLANSKPETQKDTKAQDKGKKALINFDTFKKGVAILLTSGFALSFIKNSSLTKNTKLVKGIKSLGNTIKKKLYEPLAFKDFEIKKSDFEQLIQSLKKSSCEEIAQGHEFIRGKYGKLTQDGTIKMYKAVLSSSKVPDISKEAVERIRLSNGVLSVSEATKISESIKTAISLGKNSIAEKKYSDVARKAVEIIENKKLLPDMDTSKLDDVVEIITETIAKNAKEVPIQVETKIKPFVDVVTQPFQFILSVAKWPYKIVSSLIKIAVSPVEKKAAQAALGKAELSKVEKNIHKVVTEVFGEQKAKSGKISQVIFANAMEQLNKKTMPYRSAEEALKTAIEQGCAPETIQKLKQNLEQKQQDLMVYVKNAVEKSFNGVTQSSNKNTDLAMMTKLASSIVTSAFLVADNYNMVMLKSDGEDKEGAKEKANERIIQRLSALFYQTMLINWFNSTFRSTYNSSLKGMVAVATPNTITTELLTRTSIGMPVKRKTYEQLQEIDEKNEKRTGLAGKYFKFMRLLTGKKPLKDRLPKEKNGVAKTTVASGSPMRVNTSSSTNVLNQFLNK